VDREDRACTHRRTVTVRVTVLPGGLPEAGELMAVNVFVLGLDEHNERILRNLPDTEKYHFHPLLSVEEMWSGEW
jgi:hypothetical protein